MPRSELGPWGKLYASLSDDTAHFTDAQFRAYISIMCIAVRGRGELPKLRPLQAIIGQENVDFLVEEGRVTVTSDNGVTVTGWDRYQAPVDRTNAQRQARFRETHASSPPSVDPVNNGVTGLLLPTSTSISTNQTTNEDHPVVDGGDRDALDRYYELTQSYPWGRNPGRWLSELQTTHGIANVVAALEVEHRDDSALKTLVGRVAARLERQAFRVAEAKRKEPKPVDPLQAQIRDAMKAHYAEDDVEAAPEPTPEAIAAGRAFFERGFGAIVKGLPSGPSAVLPSSQNGSSGNGRSLTVGKGSGREPAAATAQGGQDFGAAPSPGREPGRINAEAEPGEPDPSRSEAPTDGAMKEKSR